ncbi:hypothetical protein [Burkholderia ubonensis]|uniref:hypothetical protein n=1 Tax=Burkholderia ubonensis TaxID=101571 RepID=UPI000AF669FA|nr:hypothetical protein [Burkholderia ubonensis]
MTEKNQKRVAAFCRFAIVYVMLFICAGNIINSMMLKWGFRDDQGGEFATSYSLVGMMNGDAPKPWVYRSSFPKAAKWLAERLDPDKQQKIYRSITRHDTLHNLFFAGVPSEYWTPAVAITYHLTYIAIVLSALFVLLLVYKLARLHGLNFGQSVGFLAAFSFIYPLTFQRGGYYYDFFEILGALGACYFLLRQRMVVCTLLIAIFSLNKETFFLVPLALFFLHDSNVALSKRFGWLAMQLAICFSTRHFIMSGYAANDGDLVIFQLWNNLKFWVNPASYLSFYNLIGKGIYTPSLQNPLMLVPLAVYFRAAWRNTPARYRRYFFAAFVPVLPLFMLFGYCDESRNFSVVFPAIILIALHGATRFDAIFGGRAAADHGGATRTPRVFGIAEVRETA